MPREADDIDIFGVYIVGCSSICLATEWWAQESQLFSVWSYYNCSELNLNLGTRTWTRVRSVRASRIEFMIAN